MSNSLITIPRVRTSIESDTVEQQTYIIKDLVLV